MRLEYALGLSLNIHVPRGENWTARSMGLGGGGRLFKVRGKGGTKTELAGIPVLQPRRGNCDSPPAKMSPAQSKFW